MSSGFKNVPSALVLAAAMALAAAAGHASAQTPEGRPQPVIEITPNVGFHWSGTIRPWDSGLEREVELDEGASFGLMIDLPVSRNLQVELLADRQRTGLSDDGGLFVPTSHLFDLDLTYLQVGLLAQWPTGRVTPFIVGTAGLATLDPRDTESASATRFSASLGTGVKIPISRVVAVRLEGRALWTDTGDWPEDDHADHDHQRRSSSGLLQGQARLGVAFSF